MTTITQDQFADIMFEAPEGTTALQLKSTLEQRGHAVEIELEEEKPGILQQMATGEFLHATEIGTGLLKSGIGAIKGAASLGEDIIGGLGRLFTPKELEEKFGFAKQEIKTAERLIPEEALATETTAESIGKFLGDLGQFLLLPSGKAKGVSVLGKVLPKTVETGLKQMALFGGLTAVQEGKIDKNAYIAGGIGLTFPLMGGLLRKAAPGVFRAGVNPKNADWQKVHDAAKNAVGKYKGGKKAIAKQAAGVIEESGTKLKELLTPVTTKWKPQQFVDDALQLADDMAKEGLETESKAIAKQAQGWLAAKGESMTAAEVLQSKQSIGKLLSKVFETGRAGDPTIASKKQALMEIWKSLSNALNEVSPQVAKLNNEMSLAYSILTPVEKALKKNVSVPGGLWDAVVNFPIRLLFKSPATTTQAAAAIDKTGALMGGGFLVRLLASMQADEPEFTDVVVPNEFTLDDAGLVSPEAGLPQEGLLPTSTQLPQDTLIPQ